MTPDSFVETHVSEAERSEVGNGIVVHRLYRSGPEPTARRALLVRFPAGSRWPGVDVHEPGPEDVYSASGTFHGLNGEGSVHGPGTFLHLAAGTKPRAIDRHRRRVVRLLPRRLTPRPSPPRRWICWWSNPKGRQKRP